MHQADEVCNANGTRDSSIVPVRRTIPTDNTSTSVLSTNGEPESAVNASDGITASEVAARNNNELQTHVFSPLGSVACYENNNSLSTNIPTDSPLSTAAHNGKSNTQTRSTNFDQEPDTRKVEATPSAVASKPRVSFDEESNTTEFTEDIPQNYEDVLTLQVPSKENLWLSCRGSANDRKRNKHWTWFPKFHRSTTSSGTSPSWFWLRGRKPKVLQPGDNMDGKLNGNHLNSIYENEVEQKLTSDDWSDTSPMDVTANGNQTCTKTELPKEHTGHQWDLDPNDQPGGSGENDSMVWTTNFLAALSILLIIVTFPFSLIYCIRIVAEYERAVVLRMGNLIPKGKGTKGPGLFFILPCIDSVRKVDLRTITFAIPPQELLTRDSVTVSVDAVVYYRVLNPVASVLNIEDAARSTRLLAQTTIRNVLGTKDLAQILMDRDEISTSMQSSLDATTDAWGVKVERVEIKDVRLPIQLQRAMAAEAEAAREARAKVIAAIGEKDAARSLKKAARVIATSPMAFQLRYLQTLCAISAEKNSTIFFPVPIDIMQNLGDFGSCGGYNAAGKLRNVNGWIGNQKQPENTTDFVDTKIGTNIKSQSTKDKAKSVLNQHSNRPVSREAPTDLMKDDVFWTQDDADDHSDTV